MDLSGNPFVDTGLMVLSTLAGNSAIDALTFADIRRVFGDGATLARHNQRLKSYTMVFGTNGPLTQHAYKKIGKNKEVYLGILNGLLKHAESEGVAGERCDLTGALTDLDFHALVSASLKSAGLPAPEQKWIGRDWVPLGGSLGNDAQALPGASRPLRASALALFALQYLPLGVFLFKGKLTCYQSTEAPLTQSLLADIIEKNQDPARIEILGKGEGTRIVLDFLLGHFEALVQHRIEYGLPERTELLLWLFSNSGTGADCAQEPIPDTVLRFIYEAVGDFSYEIRRVLANDPKNSHFQLFECIRDGRDYPSLYPYKKWQGASPEFYRFYQERIRGIEPLALSIAARLASRMIEESTPAERKEMGKPEYLRDATGRNRARKAAAAHLSLDEYDALFPSTHHPIRVHPKGWELLRFYLGTPALPPVAKAVEVHTVKTTHPKIIQIGDAYFAYKGPRKIKDTLDRLAQRKLGVRWLQDVFCIIAEDPRHADFNLGEWDEFVCDEENKPVVFELLFQLRLFLANKYRESSAASMPRKLPGPRDEKKRDEKEITD